jgi:hypothetical protein
MNSNSWTSISEYSDFSELIGEFGSLFLERRRLPHSTFANDGKGNVREPWQPLQSRSAASRYARMAESREPTRSDKSTYSIWLGPNAVVLAGLPLHAGRILSSIEVRDINENDSRLLHEPGIRQCVLPTRR